MLSKVSTYVLCIVPIIRANALSKLIQLAFKKWQKMNTFLLFKKKPLLFKNADQTEIKGSNRLSSMRLLRFLYEFKGPPSLNCKNLFPASEDKNMWRIFSRGARYANNQYRNAYALAVMISYCTYRLHFVAAMVYRKKRTNELQIRLRRRQGAYRYISCNAWECHSCWIRAPHHNKHNFLCLSAKTSLFLIKSAKNLKINLK